MKTKIFLIVTLLLLNCLIAEGKEVVSESNSPVEGIFKVYANENLSALTTKWAAEYSAQNPGLKIEVVQAAANNIADLLANDSGIAFTSDQSYAAIGNHSIWSIVVGHDVIVPVMNAKNPLLVEIYQKGIGSQALAQIINNPDKRNWGELVGNSQNVPLHLFFANDPTVVSGISNFLNDSQSAAEGVQSLSIAELITKIGNDPNALGFCKLIDITDPLNQELVADLKLVPIDKNGNGKMDYMENIYENLSTFSRGVWIGKYPKSLSLNIYSVLAERPQSKNEVDFLKWILADGQKYLSMNGYSDMVRAEKQTQLAKFDDQAIYADIPVQSTNSVMGILLLILVVIIAISIVLDLVFRQRRNHKVGVSISSVKSNGVFDEESVSIPRGIYFDKTHTWAFMRKSGSVKVGIDDFLQRVTGNISRVEMKKAGEQVKKGELLVSIIRNGKLLHINSPISGKIIENNRDLISDSSLLNSAPYDQGWVYVIEPTNWGLEIQYLSMAEKYKTWVKEELLRLKDFFTTAIRSNSPELMPAILQDGGSLKDNVLADLGPEIWEDFQTKFIDTSK